MDEKVKKLRECEGKVVKLWYNGSDLPNGVVGPQELVGLITNVGIHECKIDLEDYPNTTLVIDDIDVDSIQVYVEKENNF